MKGNAKRILIILLSVMLIMTYMIPGSVFAETTRAAGDIYEPADSLEDGGEYLIVNTDSAGTAYALTNSGSSSLGRTEITISDDSTITAPSDSIIWTAVTNADGFNLTNGEKYLIGASGQVSISSSPNSSRYWEYNSNHQLQYRGGSSTYYIYYSSSNNNFTGTTSSGSTRVVYLFKKAAAGTAAVTGVSLDKTSLELKQGGTASLKATVAPSDAANKAVTWSTSDASVATVENGTVTAVGAGNATITVTTEEGGFTATCAVTVTEAQLEDYVLQEAPEAGKAYLIVSSNEAGSAYALTNPGGTSSGANMGATAVTIAEKNGKMTVSLEDTDAVLWDVTANGEGFNLSNGTDTLEGKSGSVKIFSSVQYADRYWTYDSNKLTHVGGQNSYVVFYDNGFTSAYSGTTEEVYFFGKDSGGSSQTDPVAVTGVSLDKSSLELKQGGTASLKATVAPSDAANKAVTWATSDASVATVGNGTVTAMGAGNATITVTTEDGGFTATCAVTVTEAQLEDYVLQEAPEAGKSYLIVSSNAAGAAYALTNPGGTSSGADMGATAVTIAEKNGKMTVSLEDTDAVLWDVTANGEGFNLSNGADTLEGKSGSVKIYSSVQYAERYWTYDSNKLTHVGGQNSYVVYYSNGFTSTYQETTEEVYFFGKDSGEGPGPDPVPVASISLDKESITVEEGKTETLTATVLPENADDPTVTWTSGDTGIATVTGGTVTGVSKGTTTITAQAGDQTAVCTVTVTEKSSGSGTVTHVGVTSDVHGNYNGLRDWLTAVQADYDPDLDSMLYCGDYSYQMSSLSSYLSDFNNMVAVSNELVGEGRSVYTSGNHEYYINGERPLDSTFTSTPGWVTIGPALEKSNYIVFCMGACEWDANGNYPQEDIDTLSDFLDSAPTDIPILIPAHFPLHTNASRATTNADKMIDLLNEHPNVIFFWGHNHSQGSDPHYGEVLTAGDSITYASGKSKEINFTYANAGGMYQDSQTQYSGVVLTISETGSDVSFQYYRATTGAPIGDSTSVHIDGTPVTKYVITASAGEHGTISPSGNVEVTEGKSKEFTFKADTGYKVDTLTVDGEEVADPGKSYTFNNVNDNHTISVTFKAKDPGEGNYYKLVSALRDGEDYLIVSTNKAGSGYALTNPGATSGGVAPTATGITIEEGDVDNDGTADKYISVEEENVIWNAAAITGGFDLTNEGGYLQGTGGNIRVSTSKADASRHWVYSNDSLTFEGGSYTYELYYNNGFTSRSFNSGSANNKIYIYEKTELVSGDDPVESIALDKTEITLKEGKSEQLTATVLPASAADKSVTWSSEDETVATVDQTGKVEAIKAGTTTVTVTSNSDSTKKATCTVIVEEYVPGSGVNVGVTSDVHGNISGLQTWLTTVQEDYDPDLDSMLYCGDYSYQMNNLSSYVSEFLQVVDATNTIVGEGKGVYTSGNHEYYIGGQEIPLDEQFTSVPGFVRIGEARVAPDYIVYCMGAASWGNNAVGEYPQADIDALEAYLDSAPDDIPILIPAHFPLHYVSGRTVTNAEKVIDVLNEHPNAIFFWGHNHSQNDPHYGQIIKEGGTIECAAGNVKEISFTYACAGGMYQDSQTNYSGVVLHIEKAGEGYDVTFQYYRTQTQVPIGDPVTVHIEAEEAVNYTITATAGENGTISPSGDVSVKSGKDRTFTFKPQAGYEVDTVTVDGEEITAEGDSYTFTNVTADHTISVTFKKAEVTEYVLTDVAKNNGNYLVVSNGFALINDNGSIGAVPVQVADDGTVLVRNSDLEKNIFWTLKDSATDETSGDFTVENNGLKISRVSGGDSGGADNPAEITEEEKYSTYSGLPYFQWSYSIDNTELTMLGGQNGDSTFYFYYNTSEDKFYTTTTEQKTGLYIPASPETVWSEPTYTWTEDYSSCTARRTGMAGNASVEDSETVETTHVTVAATCETDGKITYTAEFSGSAFETQTKEVIISATGHDWGKTTYTWAADNSSVTASHTCNTDPSHTESETVDSISEVTKQATCEEKGETTYTAIFTKPDFEQQTKTVANIDALGHNWGEAQFTWSEDNSTVRASRTCANDPSHIETETATAEAAITKAATCEEGGETTYTAVFENEAFGTQTKTLQNIEALGHDWSEVSYTWAEDKSTVKAERTCGHNAAHVQSEIVGTTLQTVNATCEADGSRTWTSAPFENEAFEVQTQTEVIPMKGHDWGAPAYVWADDNSEVTATVICANDPAHTQTETVETTAVIVEATADNDGSATYTAIFENEMFETQTRVVSIPALGHVFEFVDFTWTPIRSGYIVVANFRCTTEEGHNVAVEANVVPEIVTPEGCETDGLIRYTATVSVENSLDGSAHSDTREDVIPAKGHDWSEVSYVWAEDNSTLTATRTCGNNSAHVETETVSVTASVTRPATCEERGETTYTSAAFENAAFTAQSRTLTDIDALGHAWGEPTYTWAEDNSTVTAERVCGNDPEHVESEIVVVTSVIVRPATCEAAGSTAYTAEFDNEAFETQTKTLEDIPALGHDYRYRGFEWSEDYSAANVVFVCRNDETEVLRIGATITNIISPEPTCETGGVITYIATVSADLTPDGKKYEATGSQVLPPKGHKYEKDDWYWASDYSKATLRLICSVCHDVHDIEAPVISEITEPTCTEGGNAKYTARTQFENKQYESTIELTLEATGHDWGKAAYTWADDNSTVTATHACKNDPDHVEEETVQVISEVTRQATCEDVGETTYRAVFTKAGFETQTKVLEDVPALGHDYEDTVTAPTCEEQGYTTHTCSRCGDTYVDTYVNAKGHDWGTVRYTWAEDNSSVTAIRTCKNDPKHIETETVSATAVTTEPGCETAGVRTFTSAEFENEAFEAQTKTEAIAALGHDFGAWTTVTEATCETAGTETHSCSRCGETETREIPATGHDWDAVKYTWASDYSSVTAERVCKNDPSHVETETVSATGKQSLAPTCTAKGKTTYTSAAFKNTAFTVQKKTVSNIPAIGHEWNAPTYTWSGDKSTVTATRVCSHNSAHKQTETVKTTKTTTAATCTKAGKTVYTAVFTNTAFKKQTKTVTIKATGHSYGEYKLTTRANTLKSGKLTRTCTKCGGKSSVLVKPVLNKASVLTATSAKISWNAVTGAQRYVIYFNDCGKDDVKRLNSTTELSYTKTGLTSGVAYKFKVYAERKIGGEWVTISSGFTGHFVAGNLSTDKKYTNVKSMAVNKSSVTLKAGGTTTIKGTATPVKTGKAILSEGHVEMYRFMSSNTAVATVSSAGKITAKAAGTCYIYVVGTNGLWKAVTVTVN